MKKTLLLLASLSLVGVAGVSFLVNKPTAVKAGDSFTVKAFKPVHINKLYDGDLEEVEEYTYNSDLQETSYTLYCMNGGKLAIEMGTSKTYDADGNKLTDINYSYDSSGEVDFSYGNLFTYDSFGEIIDEIDFSQEPGGPRNDEAHYSWTFTRENDNKKITRKEFDELHSHALIEKQVTYYDDLGRITREELEDYTGFWARTRDYTYQGNFTQFKTLITKTSEDTSDVDDCTFYSKEERTFDAAGNGTRLDVYEFDESNLQYVTLDEYDSLNRLTKEARYVKDYAYGQPLVPAGLCYETFFTYYKETNEYVTRVEDQYSDGQVANVLSSTRTFNSHGVPDKLVTANVYGGEPDSVFTELYTYGNRFEHTLTEWDGQDATADEDGYKPCYRCIYCNTYYEDAEGLIPIGDEYDYEQWKLNAGKEIYQEFTFFDSKGNKVYSSPTTWDFQKDGYGDTHLYVYQNGLRMTGFCDYDLNFEYSGSDAFLIFDNCEITGGIYSEVVSINNASSFKAVIKGEVSLGGYDAGRSLYGCPDIKIVSEGEEEAKLTGAFYHLGNRIITIDGKNLSVFLNCIDTQGFILNNGNVTIEETDLEVKICQINGGSLTLTEGSIYVKNSGGTGEGVLKINGGTIDVTAYRGDAAFMAKSGIEIDDSLAFVGSKYNFTTIVKGQVEVIESIYTVTDAQKGILSHGYVVDKATYHLPILVEGEDSTCTEHGLEDAYYCNLCDQYFSDEACEDLIGDYVDYLNWTCGDGEKDLLNHNMTLVPGTPATEEATGIEDAYYCDQCELYYEDAEGNQEIGDAAALTLWKENEGKLSKLVHLPELVEGKDATEDEVGYKDAYCCKNCHKYYEDAEGKILIGDEAAYDTWKAAGGKLPILTHDTVLVPRKDATQDEAGYKDAYYCKNCDKYYEDEAATILIGDQAAYEAWKTSKAGSIAKIPTGLSGGAVAGIVIGSVVGAALIAFVVSYILWKKAAVVIPVVGIFLVPAYRWMNNLMFKTKLNNVEAKASGDKKEDPKKK